MALLTCCSVVVSLFMEAKRGKILAAVKQQDSLHTYIRQCQQQIDFKANGNIYKLNPPKHRKKATSIICLLCFGILLLFSYRWLTFFHLFIFIPITEYQTQLLLFFLPSYMLVLYYIFILLAIPVDD